MSSSDFEMLKTDLHGDQIDAFVVKTSIEDSYLRVFSVVDGVENHVCGQDC